MITWPIFLALFLAVVAIIVKVKSENKAIKTENEILETKKSEDQESSGKEDE